MQNDSAKYKWKHFYPEFWFPSPIFSGAGACMFFSWFRDKENVRLWHVEVLLRSKVEMRSGATNQRTKKKNQLGKFVAGNQRSSSAICGDTTPENSVPRGDTFSHQLLNNICMRFLICIPIDLFSISSKSRVLTYIETQFLFRQYYCFETFPGGRIVNLHISVSKTTYSTQKQTILVCYVIVVTARFSGSCQTSEGKFHQKSWQTFNVFHHFFTQNILFPIEKYYWIKQ